MTQDKARQGKARHRKSVLSKLFKAFMRYCRNNIWPDEKTDRQMHGHFPSKTGYPPPWFTSTTYFRRQYDTIRYDIFTCAQKL